MGGAASEVTPATTRIALESAWFRPAMVRAASKTLGLRTEASIRFERGVDLGGPARGAARALALLERIGAGTARGPLVDVQPLATPRTEVVLTRAALARLTGDDIPPADVERILRALQFRPDGTNDGWTVIVPSFRIDVTREADLIEEVARHWGYDRIPATFPPLRSVPRLSAPSVARGRLLRRVLCGAGLQEAVTFTFIESAAAAPFTAGEPDVRIQNPLSEKFASLRPSLAPGLLESLAHSRRRESADVRLFEAGAVFTPGGERQRVGWVMTGSRGEHWSQPPAPLAFTDVRGVADLLAETFGVELLVEACARPWLVPGRRADLRIDGQPQPCGWIVLIAPALARAAGAAEGDDVWAGEIDLDAICPGALPAARRIEPLPRFPSVVRDVSIFVEERLPAARLRDTIRSHAPATLASVREFDRYTGKGVAAGQISLSLRLTFRAPDRTLTDAEVQQAMDVIVDALRREHQAVLRGAAGPATPE
jgi:phenylalanyl-tRNA synthetase beta chain